MARTNNNESNYVTVKLETSKYANYEYNEDYKTELITDLICLFRKELTWPYKVSIVLSNALFMTLGNFSMETCLSLCLNHKNFITIREIYYEHNKQKENTIIALIESKIQLIFNISKGYIKINNY